MDDAMKDQLNFAASHSFDMRDDYTSELPPFTLQQMQHNTSHVEDVNMKMRIPSKLTVAYREDEDAALPNGDVSYSMEVPETIVVSGNPFTLLLLICYVDSC